jgi:hypothetical protein
MATGRSNYLTKQTGEYIVAAELSRRGFIATTFTGNVPSYDIVAVDEQGGHALVQVKAIQGHSWQLDAGDFAEIEMNGQQQIIRAPRNDPYPDLICVMVQIAAADSGRADRFFVLPWRELGGIVIKHHSDFLAKRGGVRPKNPESLHVSIHPDELAKWKDQWQVLTERVRPTTVSQDAAAPLKSAAAKQ